MMTKTHNTHPLEEIYTLLNYNIPKITPVEVKEIPEPQRTILVHDNDMTPTVDSFYNTKTDLSVFLQISNRRAVYAFSNFKYSRT